MARTPYAAETVDAVRRLLELGQPYRLIRDQTGVNLRVISRIARGEYRPTKRQPALVVARTRKFPARARCGCGSLTDRHPCPACTADYLARMRGLLAKLRDAAEGQATRQARRARRRNQHDQQPADLTSKLTTAQRQRLIKLRAAKRQRGDA